MIRKEILLTLAGCLTFYSCASTNLLLTKKNCENKFELIIRNKSDEDIIIPKYYFNFIEEDIANDQFDIKSNRGENAWFCGAVYSVRIPEYREDPNYYCVIKKGDSYSVEVGDISKNYSFQNDYKYFVIRYNGFLGKSNRLKISKKLIPVHRSLQIEEDSEKR